MNMTYGNGELPNGGWVPVSERLPERNGRYLAYIISKHTGLRHIVTCEYNADGCLKWYPDDACISANVVAWMPLPEEYKEEGEENGQTL